MKIDRYYNSSENDNKSRINTPMYNCVLYVRSDFTVSSATEDYYEFVGENSVLPFTELIDPEDADILKDGISNDCREAVELYTRLSNHLDKGWRNVYLKLESSDHTEEGKKLYRIKLIDIIDAENRITHLYNAAQKYRFYMSIKDEYYFEYYPESNHYTVYKYVNGKAI